MNRISMIQQLLADGIDPKDAPKLASEALKDRASFYSKLIKAQQTMETIVKNESGHKGPYAGVDQFVQKASEAMQNAGLAIFGEDAREFNRSTTNKDGIEVSTQHWELSVVIGDHTTGYRQSVRWCLPVGREQAAGASDSYAMKYVVRGVMFAERAKDDPDRKHDIDKGKAGQNGQRGPQVPKNTMTAKPSKRAAKGRVQRARDRLKVCSEELGPDAAKEIMRDAGLGAPKNADHLESAADLLENRIIFDRLHIKLVDRLGQPKVDVITKDIGDVNNIIALKEGVSVFVTALNKKAEA